MKLKLDYDPGRDFVPVAIAIRQPGLFIVRRSFPAKTVPDLIAYAKANPGKVTFGIQGLGSEFHVAMEILNKDDIPCGPILSMKELAEDQSLRATGTVVEVDHPTRGKYISVGNPIKLSDSPSDVKRSPLLGEHTDEILRQVLGFSDHQVKEIHDSGALDPPRKQAAE